MHRVHELCVELPHGKMRTIMTTKADDCLHGYWRGSHPASFWSTKFDYLMSMRSGSTLILWVWLRASSWIATKCIDKLEHDWVTPKFYGFPRRSKIMGDWQTTQAPWLKKEQSHVALEANSTCFFSTSSAPRLQVFSKRRLCIGVYQPKRRNLGGFWAVASVKCKSGRRGS